MQFGTCWKLISLAMSVAGAMTAAATTYFVSPSGSDANEGTSKQKAWKTIVKANTVAFQPGDSLLFEGQGVFAGNLYFDDKDAGLADANVVIGVYGAGRAVINAGDGAGISIYNAGGFRIEHLVVVGSGMASNTKSGIEAYADLPGDVRLPGIRISDVKVHQFGRVGIRIGAWAGKTGYDAILIEDAEVHHNQWDGIQVYGFFPMDGYSHRNVVIRRCASYRNPGVSDPKAIRGSGITVASVDGALIESCVAYENGENNIHCGGPGGIWAYDANAVIIQYCESYNNKSKSPCDGLGFDLDGAVTNSIIQYCYSHGNTGGGYLLGQYPGARPWRNNTCRYNVSVNDGRTNASAITLFKGSTDIVMDSVFVYNNSVIVTPSTDNPNVGAFQMTLWNSGITNVLVANNVFVARGGAPLVSVPIGYQAALRGNLYWTEGAPFVIDYDGMRYPSLLDLQASSVNETDNGKGTGVQADPRLQDPSFQGTMHPRSVRDLSAFAISSTSAAYNAGLDLRLMFGIDVGRTDIRGNRIAMDGAFDIGAFESPGAVSVTERQNLPAVHAKVTPGGLITVAFEPMPVEWHFTLYDARGVVVDRSTAGSGQTSVEFLVPASGVYFVRAGAKDKLSIITTPVVVGR